MCAGISWRRAGLWAGAALLAASLLALQIARFHGLRYDDAYITYRYGQNLATGHGLVFNPGERIMGSTSPLHALLSALIYALVGKEALPSVMAALGCAGWMAQAIAVFFLLRAALGALPAFLAALAVAVGAAGSSEWVTLETNLVAAFALWAVVAAVASRWTAAALLLGLAGLTRPDAYLLALPLGLLALPALRAGRLRWWPPALAFTAVTVPWLVFAAVYFGTVVPQSAATKAGRAAPGTYLLHLLTEPAKALIPGRDRPAWIVLAWLLIVAGAAFLVARRPRLWVLPAWGLLHFAAYSLLRPFTAHRWHLYPLVLVAVLGALSAVAAVAHREPRRLTRPLAVVALAAAVVLAAAHTVWWAQTHLETRRFGSRDRVYRQTVEYLRARSRPGDDLVAAVEVGTLGYYGGFRMFDLGGLITRPPGDLAAWPHPDWFVLDTWYLYIVPKEKPVAAFRNGPFTAYIFAVSPRSRAAVAAAAPGAGAALQPTRPPFTGGEPPFVGR